MKRYIFFLLALLALPAFTCLPAQQPTPRYYHQNFHIEANDSATVYVIPSQADEIRQDVAASGNSGDMAALAIPIVMFIILVVVGFLWALIRPLWMGEA
jgi:hypothetical protein